MDDLCVLGQLLILLIIGCVAFVVLGIPLFYTLITRWLTADGAPVIDVEGMTGGAAVAPAAASPAVKPGGVAAAKRDDLKALPGLLAEMEAKLNHAGIETYAKLASLGDAEVDALADQLSFRNRATWSSWRAKAGELGQSS